MQRLIGLFRLMRPRQWLKNVVLFAGVVFAELFTSPTALLRSLAAFGIFCLLSGAVYALNDAVDAERDRSHPHKKNRPVASGLVSRTAAYAWSFILAAGGLLAAWTVTDGFLVVGAVYLGLNLVYSFWAKKVVILDVLLVAFGFVLRAIGGVEALVDLSPGLKASPWFLAVTLFLALFLALEKRRAELKSLAEGAENHRKTLSEYSVRLLDQMSAVVTTATVVAYSLYTLWPTTVEKFGTEGLVYTVPFVLYGIFRYLYDVEQRRLGGNPSAILSRDVSLLVNILLWAAAVVLILYFKP
jgi:4-hydroxybenzoate polyprenyltransferase